MNGHLRIGLVGAGEHSLTNHAAPLQHYASTPEFAGKVELTGIYDINIERARAAAKQYGFTRAFDSLQSMLGSVDAVLSIVQPNVLVEVLGPILEHKLAVVIEKPLGKNLADTDRISDMLRGRRHMVSMNRRFDPAVRIAREWLMQQAPARTIHGLIARHNRNEPDFVWGTGIHLTDVMCFMAGALKLESGRVISGTSGASRLGVISGRDGLTGTIQILPSSGRLEEAIHMSGEGWSVEVSTGYIQPWRVRCWKNGKLEIDGAAREGIPIFERNGSGNETAYFLRALLNNEQYLTPTVTDARAGSEFASSLQNV